MKPSKRPICCGAVCTPAMRFYPEPGRFHSVEFSFHCDRCGRIRVPYESAGLEKEMAEYMAGMDAMRGQGIAFDLSLG